jgi:hypothetical protein
MTFDVLMAVRVTPCYQRVELNIVLVKHPIFPNYNRLPNVTILEEKHRYRYMHICMHICSHKRLFLPYVFHTVWCLSKSYAHTNSCKKKQLVEKNEREEKEKQKRKTQQHRLVTNVRVPGFKAGLLARSQFAFGRS